MASSSRSQGLPDTVFTGRTSRCQISWLNFVLSLQTGFTLVVLGERRALANLDENLLLPALL